MSMHKGHYKEDTHPHNAEHLRGTLQTGLAWLLFSHYGKTDPHRMLRGWRGPGQDGATTAAFVPGSDESDASDSGHWVMRIRSCGESKGSCRLLRTITPPKPEED